MTRQARIDAPGALHHIIARGIERRKLFRTPKDYQDFLARLARLLAETKTECYAWALLPNHFHLLLKTGNSPIASVMRSLLTGYAVSFNRRHHRQGHLFQNRYKSILCQEDTYLLELVRYIHLNPWRAGIVSDLDSLRRFPYAGHGTLTGEQAQEWQTTAEVLAQFDRQLDQARGQYRDFVEAGAGQGRRPELTGGGMVRSLGGWEAVKELGKAREFYKSDERMLGDSDFVEQTLKGAAEAWKRQQDLRGKGVGLEHILPIVARLEAIPAEELMSPGKERPRVRARSLLCYWAVHELGLTMTALAREIGLSVPAIAMAVRRGQEIARKNNYSLRTILKL